MLGMNQFMTICALGMGATQFIFLFNFIYSMFFGPPAGRNPWHANSLEWFAPSPPGHGNFDMQPIVYPVGRTSTARRKSTPIIIRKPSRRPRIARKHRRRIDADTLTSG